MYDEDGFLSATINARNICSLRNLYDASGRVIEQIYPNGTKSVIDYLKSGRVGNYIHYDAEGVLDSAKYEYDAVGNTIGINRFRRDIPEQSGNYQYEYDRMNRLVEVQKDEEVLRQYGYDAYVTYSA
ncbi:MAG: hypothetical protein Q4D54_04525 [Eubacteriales bacterium]|nr:hypothetical protein [Eubacteriales bacterium]